MIATLIVLSIAKLKAAPQSIRPEAASWFISIIPSFPSFSVTSRFSINFIRSPMRKKQSEQMLYICQKVRYRLKNRRSATGFGLSNCHRKYARKIHESYCVKYIFTLVKYYSIHGCDDHCMQAALLFRSLFTQSSGSASLLCQTAISSWIFQGFFKDRIPIQ